MLGLFFVIWNSYLYFLLIFVALDELVQLPAKCRQALEISKSFYYCNCFFSILAYLSTLCYQSLLCARVQGQHAHAGPLLPRLANNKFNFQIFPSGTTERLFSLVFLSSQFFKHDTKYCDGENVPSFLIGIYQIPFKIFLCELEIHLVDIIIFHYIM